MKRSTATGLMIGAAVVVGIYAGYDVFNAVSYKNLSEQLCREEKANRIALGLGWKGKEDTDICYKTVETVACWGLANGKTGPRPPNGCP